MDYLKINRFIKENNLLVNQLIKREIKELKDFKSEIKSSKNKSSKIYTITKDISKLIDLYDENNKVKINREKFIKDYFLPLISEYIPENRYDDYRDVMDIIIGETVSFDKNNWEIIYDKLTEVVKKEDIDPNDLYSLNYEDLKPKKLINVLKKNIHDEMIEGGTFSFETYTQEMLGIINEFVLLKGKLTTKMYLDQGANSNIQIEELLKEVNAASLVEPFSFTGESPQFNRASSGQFDGFILHRNQAKVVLATKSETTNIENDSLFRHFLTSIVLKKKIDETELNEDAKKRKINNWMNYYLEKDKINEAIIKYKVRKRIIKKEKNLPIDESDYFVSEDFYFNLNKQIKTAERDNKQIIQIPITNENVENYVDNDFINHAFKLNKDNLNKVIRVNLTTAKEALKKVKNELIDKKLFEEAYESNIEEKVFSRKFMEQIELDVKKSTMVMNNQYLSIKDMIADYNRHPKKALSELGIFNNENTINELGIDEIDKIEEIAKHHQVEVIYFGAVSNKKNVNEFEYDKSNRKEQFKNKEYRYGLNILAYANELSGANKENFKISPDAALDFVNMIQLRALTNEKNDIDLKKINKYDFLSNVIDTTYETFYNKKIIENDSIVFWENFVNASNVILSDVLLGYELDKEEDNDISIEQSFNKTMSYRTQKRGKEFNLFNTVDSLKYYIEQNSKKLNKNVGILDSLNQRVDKVIDLSKDERMQKIKEKYAIKTTDENKIKRRTRRNF